MYRRFEIPDREKLYNLYCLENKSPNEIAELYSTSRPTVKKWLRTYEIELRSHEAATKIVAHNQIGIYRKTEEPRKFLDDEEWLKYKRLVEKKSIEDIAKELNTHSPLVKKYCEKYELNGRLAKTSNINQFTDEKYLEMYNSGMSVNEISKKYNIHNLHLKFKEMGVEFRPANEYERKIHKVSEVELSLVEWIKSIYTGDIETSTRKYLNGLELDIVIPEKKFAIEYNGLFWHSEEGGKGKQYHLEKSKGAAEHGIFLFHVFADQWEFKPEIVKSMIRNRLGLTRRKIFARNTCIKEITRSEKDNFLNENHIQGRDFSSIYYGLFLEDEMISCVSFSVMANNEYKLLRFCSKINTNVVGGFSKLLSHFEKNHNGKIITYSDISYSDGKLYKDNGFILEKINGPSYYYIDKPIKHRIHKFLFRKQILSKRYELDVNLTEREMTSLLGFKRIWDCGTIRWTKEIK